MQKSFEYLLNLIGEDKAENILKDYVQAKLVNVPKGKGGTMGQLREMRREDAQKTGRTEWVAWTPEEKTDVLNRAKTLYAESQNWASVSIQLSKEFNRTAGALYNYIYKLRKTIQGDSNESK